MSDNAFRIAVLPGDGIGVEVMDACLVVLEKLEEKTKAFALAPETLPVSSPAFVPSGQFQVCRCRSLIHGPRISTS